MAKEYQKFYQLDIWKEAFDLQKEIFELTRQFPSEERYGLISQTNDSADSILANIAESHGRFYFADKIRVLYIVRGELEETQSHILVAQSRKYMEKEICAKLIDRYEKLKMKINVYIGDLMRQKGKQ